MAQKFLIYDNNILIGSGVDYHSEFLPHGYDKTLIAGGGWWHDDEENKILYFYGSSTDFGYANKEHFEKILPETMIPIRWDEEDGYKYFFSYEHELSKVLEEYQNQ
jgi:hypothetical protein